MSYAVSMSAEEVKCRIPLADLPKLTIRFENILFERGEVSFEQEWEEDGEPIRGKIVGTNIHLNPVQGGTYKNSSDGGLGYLIEKYKGSGIITEDGEEGGDTTVTKWINGKSKEGRIVFDDDDENEDDPIEDALVDDDEDDPEYDDETIEEDEEYDRIMIQESGLIEHIGKLNGILLVEQTYPSKPQIKKADSDTKNSEKPPVKPSRFDNII